MVEKTDALRRLGAPAMTAGAVLALSGCAATHIGEDWQCPLAQGTQCTSVAAADPAVKPAGSAGRPAGPEAISRANDAARPVEDAGTESDCVRHCDPFAWLGRLFAGGDSGNGDGANDADAADIDGPDGSAQETVVRAGSEAAQEPEADAAASAEETSEEPLRAPETIGRIWVAPWVDGDGVYREASWVRIVIAPADWKRP